MAQIFPASVNGVARLVMMLIPIATAAVIAGSYGWIRSSFVTRTDRAVDQPVPFSHQHHVGGLGIDCRYCHSSVETSAFAGLPATEVCMTCHSELWTDAAMLAPIRQSLVSGEPVRWRRVNDLADFVYFNHAVHVANGVGCVTCHGPVDRMPLTRRKNPMHMRWCLDCHRDPAKHLRPREAVFRTDWSPPPDPAALRRVLMKTYDIDPERLTDCYVCHR